MYQEIGETRNAIMQEDNKQIQKILNENKHLKNKYWIVLFAKPAKVKVDGKFTLIKVLKAYKTKPTPQVGMIVGEIDNSKGTVKWDINMPQVPFDYDKLQEKGAKATNDVIVETTSIPNAYICRQEDEI